MPRADDGRSGKVLAIRFTDSERAELQEAARSEAEERGYSLWTTRQYPVGTWVRKTALRVARERLQAGTTAVDGHRGGSTPPRAGTTPRRRAVVPRARGTTRKPAGRRKRGR